VSTATIYAHFPNKQKLLHSLLQQRWERALAAMVEGAGKPRDATAFVMYQGKRFRMPRSLPAPLQGVARFVAPYTKAGWAFAILSPRSRGARGPMRCG
jgi:AcrR family transcriptional regulator